MRKLDAYIEMYLYSENLAGAESQRVNALLIEREQALGLTSEELNELLPLIDDYSKDESAYDALVCKYKNLRK